MSKFTTEVRHICETYSGDPTLSPEEQIDIAKDEIFNDSWNAETEEHKEELERKILRHYYMREIGAETVPLWKFQLNTKLAEIMPKYNIMFNALNDVKGKLFETVDFWEESEGTADGTSESTSNGTSHATTHDSDTQTSKSTAEGSSENHTTANSTGQSEAWQKYNDTPQGAVTGLESDTYLTNATKNVADNSGTNKSDSNGSSKDSTDNTTTGTSDTTSDANSTSKDSGKDHNENTNSRHVAGKNSGGDYLDQYIKLMNNYNDIDQMVIAELEPLFFGLWE